MTAQNQEFKLKKQMHFDRESWTQSSIERDTKTRGYASVHIIDEGTNFLLSRRAMAKDTVQAMETVQKIRKFGALHLVCIPSIKSLDKYWREERLASAFHVTGRGKVTIYPNLKGARYARLLTIPKGKKYLDKIYPKDERMRDSFDSYESMYGSKKWDEYERYCKDHMETALKFEDKTEPMQYLGRSSILKMFDVSQRLWGQFLIEKKDDIYLSKGGTWKTDPETFKQWYFDIKGEDRI